MSTPKKLIEVALPLEAINLASAREKSIRHGHPSTLHLWWARRPLAACRAVIFASLVDDPSTFTANEGEAEKERQRLFRIIEQLIQWENSDNRTVIEAARNEISRSTREAMPPVLDPFCGGGSIPLEAQRLGLDIQAGDLNPVAVLITKALIDMPARFKGMPPVNRRDRPRLHAEENVWKGASGLAADVRYYGAWMQAEAERRIGQRYPKVTLPKHQGAGEATVVAWIWARTVVCSNPACGGLVPLVRSFSLSTKQGAETWLEPILEPRTKTVSFEVRAGSGKPREGTVNRLGATCLLCKSPVPFDYIRSEGKAKRIGAQLIAIVAELKRGRAYLAADPVHQARALALSALEKDVPDTELPERALGFRVQAYGMTKHRDLFTARQLMALSTFAGLVTEAAAQARDDAIRAGLEDNEVGLESGGTGARAYADAIATYLAFAVDKGANYWSTLCAWHSGRDSIMSTFARQALAMVWDFAEANPFSHSSGNFLSGIEQAAESLDAAPATRVGTVRQIDATSTLGKVKASLLCTDPPYYDNIGYADLSDFFYVWLRRPLASVFPSLLSTIVTPKRQELVATPYRFDGDRRRAERFFEEGLYRAFVLMREAQAPGYPLTMFYAFKQSESDTEDDGTTPAVTSTGWETMLEGLLRASLSITGTWPMRTELTTNLKKDVGALASSIIIVCRPRSIDAPLSTRKDFAKDLKRELPEALKRLQHGNIAPVDLAQAAIGPGMAIFSRYSKVLEADGTPMRVRAALGLINQAVDEVLAEQESEYDSPTRWAIAWFDQFGMADGPFGAAEILSKAKDTAVSGMRFMRIRGSKVRLLRREEMSEVWDPNSSPRLTVWEAMHHLIKALETRGEVGAAALARRLGSLGTASRDLAYRLYSTCERKGWTDEKIAYNSLVAAWPEIARLVGQSECVLEQTAYL